MTHNIVASTLRRLLAATLVTAAAPSVASAQALFSFSVGPNDVGNYILTHPHGDTGAFLNDVTRATIRANCDRAAPDKLKFFMALENKALTGTNWVINGVCQQGMGLDAKFGSWGGSINSLDSITALGLFAQFPSIDMIGPIINGNGTQTTLLFAYDVH